MALWSCSSSYTGQLQSRIRQGDASGSFGCRNAGCKSRLGRTNLQVCAALRHESLPKKKHKQTDDLLAELEDEIQPFLELQRESRLRTMRHYEVMFLVHEAKVGELEDIINKYKGFVKEKKGRIWRFNDWGMRRLAYKIKKTWKANYILMNIEVAPEFINEFDRLLEKDERIIRHMVITRKKPQTKDTVPPEDLPPSRAELLEAEIAEEEAAEAAADKEAMEAKAAKRKARRAAAAAALAEDEDEEDDSEDEDDDEADEAADAMVGDDDEEDEDMDDEDEDEEFDSDEEFDDEESDDDAKDDEKDNEKDNDEQETAKNSSKKRT